MGHESSRSGGADEEADSSGLQRVVWFRQMLHRWQSSSSSRSATAERSSDDGGDGDSPDAATTDRNNDDDDGTPDPVDNASSSSMNPPHCAADDADADDRRRLPRVLVVEERIRREDAAAACESPMTPDVAAPADVPRGCCPVYVGAERRRFVVPTAYLGSPVFRRLLEKAEEEFEFHYHGGAVTIPCDVEAFKYILVVMDRHRQGLVDDGAFVARPPRAASAFAQAQWERQLRFFFSLSGIGLSRPAASVGRPRLSQLRPRNLIRFLFFHFTEGNDKHGEREAPPSQSQQALDNNEAPVKGDAS